MTETVREIAMNQPSSIRVFEQFGIDYCCGGNKALAEACAERNVALDGVLAALDAAKKTSANENEDWAKATLGRLVQHIVISHHEYVRRELPRLDAMAAKVIAQHGSNHPELRDIQAALLQLEEELLQHLAKEEMVLFPYITQLELALTGSGTMPHGCFGTVANPIAMMTQEHDGAGELLKTMRRLSNGYTAPKDACTTFHAFYKGLQEFEQDLHQHIHLENNILFPRAIELEKGSPC